MTAISNPDLLACIRLLRQRQEQGKADADERVQMRDMASHLATLRLAESALEKVDLRAANQQLPTQIVVIGPTQSGKSTLVNLITGREIAEVSPMAGFTVHPQGFAFIREAAALSSVADYFHGYRRVDVHALPADRYGFFSLQAVAGEPLETLGEIVVWDTPDFDSVSAHDYANAVLRTVALADVVVLVVSRDKYADQSVWDTMQLIEPLRQPTVVCLNKIDVDVAPTLVRSFQDKWREFRRDDVPAIVTLPYTNPVDADAAEPLAAQRPKLLIAVGAAVASARRGGAAAPTDLVRRHWVSWTAPLRQEHEAVEVWNATVDSMASEALAIYRRDYLDHPQHYETFQRALAELLTLLEVPGIGGLMLAARKAVTWPMRQLSRLGGSGRSTVGDGSDQESAVLIGISEHVLIHANELALGKCEESVALRHWWAVMATAVRVLRMQGKDRSAQAVAAYQRAFQPQVESTARQLLDGLKQHPAALNSLRAARFTTDAMAVAMALHTGGIGVQDFVIAPAILAVTSLMAEGVLGRFMLRAEQDLKRQQLLAVESLLRASVVKSLTDIPIAMAAGQPYHIPFELLERVERAWN